MAIRRVVKLFSIESKVQKIPVDFVTLDFENLNSQVSIYLVQYSLVLLIPLS